MGPRPGRPQRRPVGAVGAGEKRSGPVPRLLARSVPPRCACVEEQGLCAACPFGVRWAARRCGCRRVLHRSVRENRSGSGRGARGENTSRPPGRSAAWTACRAEGVGDVAVVLGAGPALVVSEVGWGHPPILARGSAPRRSSACHPQAVPDGFPREADGDGPRGGGGGGRRKRGCHDASERTVPRSPGRWVHHTAHQRATAINCLPVPGVCRMSKRYRRPLPRTRTVACPRLCGMGRPRCPTLSSGTRPLYASPSYSGGPAR